MANRRVGKYKVSKREQSIYEHDVQNGTFTNMDLGGTLDVTGLTTLDAACTVGTTLGVTGATTLAAVTATGNAILGNADTDAHTLRGTVAGYRALVESVTADDSLTAAESGKTFVFADAAATLTLPDSGGGDIIGVSFKFYSNFQGTGQKVVCTDTTNEKFYGNLNTVHVDDDAAAAVPWNAKASDNFSSINFNSVAQGEPGSSFTVTNVAADVWLVEGNILQSGGSEATPFATT